jgi:hypothetical protein
MELGPLVLSLPIRLIQGVLTKADTVQEGEHASWLAILNHKSHKLSHGWYATRLASTKEKDQAWEIVRRNEVNYFQRTQPWAKEVNKTRLGTGPLTEALSAALTQKLESTYDSHS